MISPWTPTIHPALNERLAAGEAALAAGQADEAQRWFEDVYGILEEDDPVDPSFNKAYVMSRRALARAQQKQADSLEEIMRCRNYLQQWDAPDGIFWFSINLTAAQIQRLLGHENAARESLEKLWKGLKAARNPSISVAALLRATAAELEGLGAARRPEEIPSAAEALRPVEPVAPARLDYVFHPLYQHRLHIVPVKQGDSTYSGADGSVAWFNPSAEADLKLLMGPYPAVLETDDPGVLARIGDPQFQPHNQCVFYQPWREPVAQRTVRLVGATVGDMLEPAGRSLAGSPVKHLFLVTGGIFRGALAAFKKGLAGHQLETLGLIWHFTGDDITDVPTMVEEIADLAAACGVQKLSLVTSAFHPGVERQMVQHFAQVPSLRECSVWEKDEASQYPRYQTPELDAMLAARSH